MTIEEKAIAIADILEGLAKCTEVNEKKQEILMESLKLISNNTRDVFIIGVINECIKHVSELKTDVTASRLLEQIVELR